MEAVLLPIGRAGVLVVGCNPHRMLDDAFTDMLRLLAGQIGAALEGARAREADRLRAEALAALDRAKTAFFSNVSHEFRTPLTLMLGPLAEAKAKAPPALRPVVETAHSNARRLLRLVNSLLDFSRLESGRTEARLVPVDLAKLTAELASQFESVMAQGKLRFVVDIGPLPGSVPVDPAMWEKIVLNLLSNALKFTLAGEVRVALRVRGGDAVEFTVSDTGVGIPADQLDRVFERFHRVEGAGGRSHEGSGIGLALVRDLLGLHGGTVTAENAPGGGSVFRVVLPAPPADGASQAVPAAGGLGQAYLDEAAGWIDDDDAVPRHEAENTDAAPGRILLADDNADMRGYVRRLLREAGHAVATAGDGEAALAMLRGGSFDLVVTDIMMPRLDGLGLLRAIRAEPRLQDMAVILLSARAGEEAMLDGIEALADGHLVKPFSPRELVARVASCLANSRARGALVANLSAEIAERTAERNRLWELSEDLLVRADHGGRLLQVSPSWSRLLGLPLRSAIGDIDHWSLVHPDDHAATRAALDAMRRTGTPVRFENRLLPHGGGAAVTIAWAFSPDRDDAANVLGIGRNVTAERAAHAGLLAEIAERERLDATMRQMQRLEAVGQLTAGVAHDFNNLLTVIVSSLEVLESHNDPVRGERQIAMIRRAARRGADLTGQLLAFSRKQYLEPRPLDLNATVRGMNELLRTTVGGRIAIATVLAEPLSEALADPTQIELAVLNLAINARDAMGGEGALTIETSHAALGPPERPEEPDAGDYVTVAVSDTGTGIAPDVVTRVFEPFFTTKPMGKGSGLGLPQVYGFAKQSGGGVSIRTELGTGTTVRIFLPRAAAQGNPSNNRVLRASP